MGLAGRVALVTGSSGGIGRATAERLANLGANVVVNSSSSVDEGRAVARSLPTDSIYVRADVGDPNEREGLVSQTIERFGRLDILVNNAGWTRVVPHGDLDGLTDEIFRRTFEVNVFGTWGLTKLAIPYLRYSDDGNVVTITSVASIRPSGSSIAYSMSKAALNQMTRLLAKSYGPVRFNSIAPGLVDTPWTSTEEWRARREEVRATIPLHRSAKPEEVADMVGVLAQSSYVTGATVLVDGGSSQVM